MTGTGRPAAPNTADAYRKPAAAGTPAESAADAYRKQAAGGTAAGTAANSYRKQTTAGTAAESAAYGRNRTGNYSSQNGRPQATASDAQPQQAQRPRPVENPYGRYSARTEEDPQYTASFRPEENQNGATHRRRTRSEKYDNEDKA